MTKPARSPFARKKIYSNAEDNCQTKSCLVEWSGPAVHNESIIDSKGLMYKIKSTSVHVPKQLVGGGAISAKH